MERQTITGRLSTSGRLSGALSVGGGTTDYNELENRPSINGEILEGNMNLWQPKNFSTEEQNTGLKWIDGKDIYVITKNVTFNSSFVDMPIPTNITIIKVEGGVNNNEGNNFVCFAYGASDIVGCYQYLSNGILRFQNDFYRDRPLGSLIIYYTKIV